jgi:hypothetical protein
MNTSTLTDRVISILATGPMLSVDVWDALGDATVTQFDVTTREGENGKPGLYSLVAQAVAS